MCARKLFPHIQAGDIAIVVARGAWCNIENSYLGIEPDMKVKKYHQLTKRTFNHDKSAKHYFFNYHVTWSGVRDPNAHFGGHQKGTKKTVFLN